MLGLAGVLASGCAGTSATIEDHRGVNTIEMDSTSRNENNKANETTLEKSAQARQVLMDTRFENGFNLLGIRSIDTGEQILDVLNYGQAYGVYPYWRLAQWGTRHNLAGTAAEELAAGVYRYANPGKSVTVDTGTGTLTLRATASEEYIEPRQEGEDWPHLLVEQHMEQPAYIEQLQELRATAELRLTQFEDRLAAADYDPARHAAQFSWYLSIQNRNSASPHYGDYLWFGMPIFDNRQAVVQESYFQDGGKEDTTHKFIYNMSAAHYMDQGLVAGEWMRMDIDILPYVQRAIELAYEEGFLQGTTPEELGVANMNIGWELPGTFDVEMELRDLSLAAVEK